MRDWHIRKILRIHVESADGPKTVDSSMEEYAEMGGRGLTSTLVAKEVLPLCHFPHFESSGRIPNRHA